MHRDFILVVDHRLEAVQSSQVYTDTCRDTGHYGIHANI